ncbi:MAG: FtsW/RodA/SpoVE family cell cycle protein [Chloroflexota bacterium]|jgi:cell division protein FtsW (lipid II flippase)
MNQNLQGRLLKLAGGFLFLHALLITLAPAVRERTWNVSLPWTHWLAFLLWAGFTARIHTDLEKRLPEADPYLFPAAALLAGWGVLTIWSIDAEFGARQALWLAVSLLLFLAGLRLRSLRFLRRYKYVLLGSGLALTALTLLFGANPSGFGPRLWLGCCNVYIQPSEPLKLLLIAYLAAYFADKLPYRLRTIHILYPTIVLGGIVVLLLIAQRDLGTASIFLALYTILAYLATNRKFIPIISLLALIVVGAAGYYFVNIVQIRIETWLNPWNDPQGGSYQVVQALIAIANGGVEGRGPGLGSPGLVPVAISDFIYAAIAEQTGLFGTLGLLALFGILVTRGLRTALRAPGIFRRLLAGGISAYIGVQAILIVGGNIRLLPLTGVTLPFVSYGGSSLLTSFAALLILLIISNPMDEEPAPLENAFPYLALHGVLLSGLFAAALTTGWWAIIRSPDLLARTDNLRRVIEERYVPRGALLDRSNASITITSGEVGSYKRSYIYPHLAPVAGYDEPTYGQAGLEAALDGYLRGLEGNPASTIWLNHLLYGTSPAGLDVRLSIDLPLQTLADELMRGRRGAVILLNAQSGEILVMASHPTFDANRLSETAADLLNDPQKPLINRAALGVYPTDSVMQPFARALFGKATLSPAQWQRVYEAFGFFRTPQVRMTAASSTSDGQDFYVSPLQMALASAALSNSGTVPAPRIAIAVNIPREGWVVLREEGTPFEACQASAAEEAAQSFVRDGENFWSHVSRAQGAESAVAWFIGGTLPNWQASPLAVVVALEGGSVSDAGQIGRELLNAAMTP